MTKPAISRMGIIVGAAAVLGLAGVPASPGAPEDFTATGGSLHQLVEARPQGRACTGVRITLSRLLFEASIAPDAIDIRDDKHDADLRSVVGWDVSRDGKHLTIRLASPSSDFGSGNALRVCLERAAFRRGHQPASDRLCWMIGTDLL
jgi:hypothetical protein